MPMTWDHEADVKLLLRMLITSNVKPDYEDLANHMGPECTISAVQHRIQRLKTDPRAVGGVSSSSSASASPEKRKRGRGKKDANGNIVDEDKASPKKAKKDEKDKNGPAVDSA